MAEKEKQAAQQPAQQQAQPQKNKLWLFDPIQIVHTDVSSKGVVYTVRFVDFMGLTHDMQFNREDCFFNFPEKVMKPLVQNGYRFNTMLDETGRVLQAVFTQYKPEAKAVADAVQKLKDGQEEKAK